MRPKTTLLLVSLGFLCMLAVQVVLSSGIGTTTSTLNPGRLSASSVTTWPYKEDFEDETVDSEPLSWSPAWDEYTSFLGFDQIMVESGNYASLHAGVGTTEASLTVPALSAGVISLDPWIGNSYGTSCSATLYIRAFDQADSLIFWCRARTTSAAPYKCKIELNCDKPTEEAWSVSQDCDTWFDMDIFFDVVACTISVSINGVNSGNFDLLPSADLEYIEIAYSTSNYIRPGGPASRLDNLSIIPASNVEDFEQLNIGNINGQTGPVGAWTTSGTAQDNNVADVSGNLVLDFEDTSSTQGCGSNAILALYKPFRAVSSVVGFKVKHLVSGVSVIYQDGAQVNVQMYFASGGSVKYENGGTLQPTGFTWQSTYWEEYEVWFYSTSKSKFRQRVLDGTPDWTAWTGELQNRDNWDSTNVKCSKLLLSSGSADMGHGYYDDLVFPPITEDHEQLSTGNINGQSDPVGAWTTSGTAQDNVVADVSGNQVLDFEDTTSAEGYGSNAILTLNVPFIAVGSVVGFKVKHLVSGVSVIYQDGAQVNVQMYFASDGSVKYENGGSLESTGLSWQTSEWEEYQVYFYSTSTSKFRQRIGTDTWSAWTGEKQNRDAWDSTSVLCTKLWLSSGSADMGHGYYDDFVFP